jgi:hypothetical protein
MPHLQESLTHDDNSPIVSISKGIHQSFILIHHGHDIILTTGMTSSPSRACFTEGLPFTMAVANSEVGLEKTTAHS